jgi:poly(3-hydroxybutyrate) depolymerase
MKLLTLLLTLSLGATLHAAGFAQMEFKGSKGTQLRYVILKPAKIKPSTKYPLVVSLHGIGGRGSQKWEDNCAANKVLSQPAMRQKYPCYIIAPTVDPNQWWDGAPLAALMQLIKSSLKKHPIDPARIYVTGQSMGGAGTYSAILAEPNLFAAAVPVCGRGQPELAKKIVHLPIWIFHGELDRVVPTIASRNMVAALKKAGGKPTYTEYAGVRHNSWTPAYADQKLWEWVFAQKRKDIGAKQSLSKFIMGKRLHFKIADEPQPFWAEFIPDGTTRHSLRPKGVYKVNKLKILVEDAEKVELIFTDHTVKAGDTFEAKVIGSDNVLKFKILKVETIPTKLTPKQVTQFFEEGVIGEWTAVDKDTKEVVEKFDGRWKKKGESIEAEGTIFENGKNKNHYTLVTRYDPKLGLFVQKIESAKGNPTNITRHIHWDPKQKIGTGEIISPKLPPGVEMKLNWKITGPNREEFKIEVYEEGKLVYKKEVILTRKAAKPEK